MQADGESSEAVLLAISDAMGTMLDTRAAENYVEFTVHKQGKPSYTVCVRRYERPTPHDLRKKAEARIAELEKQVSDQRK